MFKVSGTEEVFRSAIDISINSMQAQYPVLDQEYWEEIHSESRNSSFEELSDLLIPVYKKYFSEDELDDIIALYNTRTGKKLAASNPLIMQESAKIGEIWGAKLGEKMLNRVNELKE